jgi:hypothetical protein
MSDLGGTIGWKLTGHARRAAAERGFDLRDVLMAAASPEVRYTAYDYGIDREIRQRGDLAVAVHEPSRTVITVLWRHQERWTDQEARSRARCA